MAYLSIIVNMYNMRREAARMLHSLTSAYQRGVAAEEYEVIVIDNGSSEPLEEGWIKAHGPQFHYLYFKSQFPAPCEAINHAVRTLARGEHVCICIDGARILSPGILRYMLDATHLYSQPFVYTVGMHIGSETQMEAVKRGYNQAVEDKIFRMYDWENDGYELFRFSCFAGSARQGFYGTITESNCFSMSKALYLSMGGLDERFTSPGGGLVNLDFFDRVHGNMDVMPVRLLGEATFHQFHGGVAANAPMGPTHPLKSYQDEYARIRGANVKHHYMRDWVTMGHFPPQAARYERR